MKNHPQKAIKAVSYHAQSKPIISTSSVRIIVNTALHMPSLYKCLMQGNTRLASNSNQYINQFTPGAVKMTAHRETKQIKQLGQ